MGESFPDDLDKPKPGNRLRLRYRHKVLIKRRVWPFAWPIFLELFCVVLMGIISTVLVSHLGAEQIAAVGITDGVTWIIISVLTATALGGSVVIAQSFGKVDRTTALDGAGQVMKLALLVALVALISILFFAHLILGVVAYGAEQAVMEMGEMYLKVVALGYPALAITLAGSGILRAVGNSRLPAMSNIIMSVLDLVISYPLIYGFVDIGLGSWQGLGLLGSALGITLARWSGALMILHCLATNSTLKVGWAQYFSRFNRETLYDILGVGVPASVESLMFNLGKLLTQVMVAGMGTVAMAGNVVTFSIVLLLNIPGNTLAMTSTILVGQRLGQDSTRKAYQEMKVIFWLATGLMMLVAIVFMIGADFAARLYTSDERVIEVVKDLVRINAVMTPVWAASFVLPAAFKGAKDAKYTMWTAIASMWGCRVVLGYVLGIYLDLNVYGVWLGMFADWWVRGALYYYRMMHRGWLKVYYRKKARQNPPSVS